METTSEKTTSIDDEIKFRSREEWLWHAAAQGDLATIKKLLKENKDINIHNSTALHVAAYYGRHEVVAALLDAKAEIEARDNYDKTPLHNAINSPEVTRSLLNAKADVNAKTEKGSTALSLLAEIGGFHTHHLEVLRNLLDSKAEVNHLSESYFSRTPLMSFLENIWQLSSANNPLVQAAFHELIYAGAKLNLTQYEKTALLYAQKSFKFKTDLIFRSPIDDLLRNFLPFIHLLVEAGARPEIYPSLTFETITTYLISQGAWIDSLKTLSDENPLTIAHLSYLKSLSSDALSYLKTSILDYLNLPEVLIDIILECLPALNDPKMQGEAIIETRLNILNLARRQREVTFYPQLQQALDRFKFSEEASTQLDLAFATLRESDTLLGTERIKKFLADRVVNAINFVRHPNLHFLLAISTIVGQEYLMNEILKSCPNTLVEKSFASEVLALIKDAQELKTQPLGLRLLENHFSLDAKSLSSGQEKKLKTQPTSFTFFHDYFSHDIKVLTNVKNKSDEPIPSPALPQKAARFFSPNSQPISGTPKVTDSKEERAPLTIAVAKLALIKLAKEFLDNPQDLELDIARLEDFSQLESFCQHQMIHNTLQEIAGYLNKSPVYARGPAHDLKIAKITQGEDLLAQINTRAEEEHNDREGKKKYAPG
ncbi:MAG TPA: ankyrin repeat domain-containing protein [Gammaproteobacteria bacterium]|nr:ankyrin repeat domain-containing protein [Gammaproteobacteria bacterium]